MSEKRNLGKSDIKITPIGLGTWQFSEEKSFQRFFWKTIDPETRTQIVNETVKSGVNWFDTAEAYGFGASERGLRDSLLELNLEYPDVLIATKWHPILRRARSIGKTIDKRIEYLSPYPITLHQVHNPFSLAKRKSEMKEMAKLLDAKKIESVGVSNFNVNQVRTAYNTLEELGYPLVSNQVHYSIFNRGIEKKLIPQAKELGMTIIAYSPLEQGLATGRFHEDPQSLNYVKFIRRRSLKGKIKESQKLIDDMKSIANNHKVTVAQVALNWLINFNGETVVAIPGASKSHHAKTNAETMKFKLSHEELNALDEASHMFI